MQQFLTSSYTPEGFQDFLYKTLKAQKIENLSPQDYKKSESPILSYTQIALPKTLKQDNDKKICFYAFEVKSIKAKMALHTEIKKIFLNTLFDAILAVFYEDSNPAQFRLSLITFGFDPQKAKRTVSNLKRQSFVLGENTNTRSAQEHLQRLHSVKSIEDLENIFAREPISTDFFKEIIKSFTDFAGSITFPTPQDDDHTRQFVLRMFSRILFCKFLEKKGVISLEIWDTRLSENYYHDVLKPLFFQTLNTQKDKRNYDLIDAKIQKLLQDIPYLNGGLFDPQPDDYAQVAHINTLKIPNDLFKQFFEILDRYHFAIDESTPIDQEVGLDPEMLGMVFENLLSVLFTDNKVDKLNSLRKKTGSYYTPREIVSYMVKSSILEHLKGKTNLDENKLKALVFDYFHEFKHEEILKIMSSLQDFKVLDPACGSGAFPMGMLQEICSILEVLDPHAQAFITLQSPKFKEENKDKDPTYIRKLSILQNNIYGVDIQPMAIEISRLRCFLSLVCEEDKEYIAPLPNLEFKFVTANSLASPSLLLNYDGYHKDLQNLQEVRIKYFLNSDQIIKNDLKEKFQKIRKKILDRTINISDDQVLADYDPFNQQSVANFFDSEYMFGFSQFDCIIGNPPYRDYRKIDKKTKEVLNKMSHIYKEGKKSSIFVYFIERAKQFVKENGSIIFINPISYICKPTDFPLRNFIDNHLQIKTIIDVSNLKIFKEADTYACINHFKNSDSISFSTIEDIGNLWNLTETKLPKTNVENLPFSLYPLLKKIQNKTTVSLDKIADIFCALSKTFRQDVCMERDEYNYKILESSNIFRYDFSSDTYIKNITNYYTQEKIDLFLNNRLIFMARMTKTIRACIAPKGFLGGKINIIHNTKINQKLLLGLLNSKVINYFYSKRFFSTHMSGGAFGFDTESVGQIPVPQITESNQSTTDKIIALVEEILEAKEQNPQANTSTQEDKINELVYQLYSLTPEEIKIIESNNG